MILRRGSFGVVLLALAATALCLGLLFTTPSDAQTRAESQNARSVAGDEDCIVFEDETGSDKTGSGEDTQSDTADTQSDTADTQDDAADQSSLQDGNADEGNSDLSSQNEDDIIADNADDQTLQNGDEEDGDTKGNGDPEQQQQQTQDENGDDDECVMAKTVPDEPLLPTGASAKSGNEKQSKTDGKSGGKQADSAGKRSSGGKKLEVQDRGKKIEVEDRSGKMPRQEKSGSRTRSASSNDVPQDKVRPGNSSSENPRTESARSESSRTESERPDPGRAEPSRAGSVRASDLAPRLAAAEWSSPSREEVDLTEGPRRFAPDPGAEMTLSARALRLYNVPVANSNRLEELDKGLVRMPDTSLPWDTGDQRNVFVAGHYLGLPETQSRMVFYNLDKLKSGDEIVLKDSLGQAYKYRVSEKFAAGPEDSWVMGQVRGRDMLTLQTCIPPDFGKRLVVRADRVQ